MTPAVQDASCAAGVFLCRGSEALPSGSYPPSKKEYFLTATTPQALARGVSAQLVQKPRRVSPPQRRKKVKSFSQATCAAKKILLRLQVWNLCAVGAQIMRAADCSPFVKKEYFLTAATPQALAHGASAQLVQKSRRVSPPQRRKKVKSFSQATCAAEKILLRLQVWNLCAVGAQIMRAADCSPFVKKEYFLTATTPQAIACGVASAWPRFIASEAGLAPSGSPAAPAHNLAAADVPETATTPQAIACGVASL